ncbi:GNAT family N-acetyltransferase [Desulfatibacillum aliphaticivorans]|uniref:GCN5-related N-acetyltransferase n=1 Tax=Desulfatibacillum aliphaticivorans TaxID=218208 RepID=B8FJJ6_DESAL|nr:GNAT family N-acetyltransferase [Desulfatibacillum aliphaticivorans]ACL05665.1 GCN5-related N-acetyltransferase [Desulfatibacillum aliphaticivorans]
MDTLLEQSQPVTGRGKGTGLRYIPVPDFSLVPRRLIEQVKPRQCSPDQLYSLGPMICKNPFNLLGVFAPMDQGSPAFGQIKGFLWASINPLDRKIHVHILSVDPEYQGKGIIEEAGNILEKIRARQKLKGIVFKTTRPKAMEKMGFKRSETILMEA